MVIRTRRPRKAALAGPSSGTSIAAFWAGLAGTRASSSPPGEMTTIWFAPAKAR
jgi:hypothetical protein